MMRCNIIVTNRRLPTPPATPPARSSLVRRGNREQRLSRGRAYRVESIDAEAGTVSLARPQGKSIAWSPARWGGDQAEAFVEVEQAAHWDPIQFTLNNRRAGRLNGHTASVVGINPQHGGIVVEREDGKHEALDLSRLADRNIRPGWVRTIHPAQATRRRRRRWHNEMELTVFASNALYKGRSLRVPDVISADTKPVP
ncbi:hypothetical protein SLG_26920 [Sphingobium sp. SYK-6]|nr:hypothetical protein SLG_26920 [Sphingobium sp. SYK-6]